MMGVQGDDHDSERKRRAGSRAQEALAVVLRTVKDGIWARALAGRGQGAARGGAVARRRGRSGVTERGGNRRRRMLAGDRASSPSPGPVARRPSPVALRTACARGCPARHPRTRLWRSSRSWDTPSASPAPASATSATLHRAMAGKCAWPTTSFRRPLFAVGAQELPDPVNYTP